MQQRLVQEAVGPVDLAEEEPRVGQSDVAGLAHDLAQPARDPEPGLGPAPAARLHEQRLAAQRGPGKAQHDARRRTLGEEAFGAEGRLAHKVPEVSEVHDGLVLRALAHEAECRLPSDAFQQLPQLSDPGLARVVPDDLRQCLGAEIHALLADAVALNRLGEQVLVRDGQLLLEDIACKPDDLHAVEQRPRDRVRDVGGADEEHAREVHGDVQVEVPEACVLGRVQHLEQRRGGVAPVVAPELVYLVDEDHRVRDPRDFQGLDHLAGHRAYVGAAVTADLGHIVEAAHGEAEKLAA
mmetsp:Transcript_31061/g.89039  ORF Transcript_31061/g.89039 Transcript_31061/m.89039 type:complete len:296 (+) Transcript_31061:552-1439(+)